MKKILIRADGSKDIGMGHINRCCLVANYLFEECGIESVMIIRNNDAVKSFLSNKFNASIVHYIPQSFSITDEQACIRQYINSEYIALILLDLLEVNLSKEYLIRLYENKIPIAAISDDSEYREIDVDVILNGNPNQLKFDYSSAKGKYLIGPEFFIMDAAYAEKIKTHRILSSSVLLTLGGCDHNNLIFGVLNALIDSPSVNEIVIITSMSTGYYDDLVNWVEHKNKNKKIKLFHDVESLEPYWDKCDIAITAGGNTLFERIASGLPGATICQLPRQIEIANKFQEIGVNLNLGYGPDIGGDDLKCLINDFIANKGEHTKQRNTCRKIINGNGIKYFIKELSNLIGDKYEL